MGLAGLGLLVSLPAAAADAPTLLAEQEDQKTPRPPIVITDDTMFTPANGVVDGSGTAKDPWVIAGWRIDGKVWSPGVAGHPTTTFPPGIFIQGTDDHVIIRDNHILDNPRAQVWLRYAEHVTIKSNILERTGDAPRRVPHDDGITIEDSENVKVQGNTIEHAGEPEGLNGIIAVTQDRDDAFDDPALKDVTIRDNLIRNTEGFDGTAHGIIVDLARRVKVSQNTIQNRGNVSLHQALEVRNTTRAQIVDNVARNPDPARESEGLLASDLDDSKVTGNIFKEQDVGIRGLTGFDVRYNDNDLNAHDRVGLRLVEGRFVDLRDNSVSGSGTGLLLDRMRNVNASGNILPGNDHGMSVRGTTVSQYDHDIDATNRVEGDPVRYLRDLDGATKKASDLDPAGYLGIVDSKDVFLNGTPDLPSNGEGLLIAGSSQVTADAGTLSGHGTTLKVVQGRDNTVRNLTGTDARVHDSRGFRLANSTLDGSGGTGLSLGPFSGGARLENLTVKNHHEVGLALNHSHGVRAHQLAVTGNVEGGILVQESDTDNPVHVHGSVIDNPGYGLNATDTLFPSNTLVDATDNYWGAPDGPSGGIHDACTGVAAIGGGDEIRTHDADVCFDPFLSSPPGDAGDPDPH